MNYLKYIKLLVFVFLLSCDNKEKQHADFVSVNLNKSESKLDLSEIVDSISYIHLETTPQCLLGEISDIHYKNGKYYVYDQQTKAIYIFDNKGRYLNKISKYGKGPGEYVLIQTFYVDFKNRIHILDLILKKILIYDHNALFVAEVPIKDYPRDFIVSDNGYFLFMPDKNTGYRRGFYYYKPETKKYKRSFDVEEINTAPILLSYYIISYCSEREQHHSILNNSNNEIFQFSNNRIASSIKFKVEPFALGSPNEENRKAYSIVFFNETQHYYLMTYASLSDVKVCLYNKKNNIVAVYNSIHNDIDGILGNPTRLSINNTMTLVVKNNNSDEGNPFLQILYFK